MPIEIPSGVEINLNDRVISVKGAKGSLERKLHKEINVEIGKENVTVNRLSDAHFHRSLHGLTRTLIYNMVKGVTEGFQKQLDIVGVGYRAALKGSDLEIQVGYSHPVKIEKVEGVDFEVPVPNKIIVKGIDKEAVGEVSAKIRSVRPPEPYKGKGIKYSDEKIRRKVGKAGK